MSENSAPPEIIIENLADAIDDETIDINSEENFETPPLPDNSDSSLLGLTSNVNVVSSDVDVVDRENVEIRVHGPSESNDEEVEVELASLFADDAHEEVIFFYYR